MEKLYRRWVGGRKGRLDEGGREGEEGKKIQETASQRRSLAGSERALRTVKVILSDPLA